MLTFAPRPAGPFDRWPLGRGFDRFYGFLGASTDQYRPELYRDNGRTAQPTTPDDGYHLTTDLVDEAITQVRNLRGVAPHQPFFLYLAPGACHTPHQVPRDWIDRYRGRFDHGWDEARHQALARQVDMGILPAGTELAPGHPDIPAWDSLSQQQRQLYVRMMEVYAGFLSHTDAQIGRFLTFLDELGELTDTLVVLMSDNGASAEGGPEGSLDEGLYLNDLPQRATDAFAHLDELGGPRFYNHYPWGWAQAGNTPFRWFKQFTHAGGVRTPCIIRCPSKVPSAPGVRSQFHHAIDVAPTILDVAGVDWPATVRGVRQLPVHGMSMAYTFDDADVTTRRTSQYFESYRNRAFWRDGWMAVSRLQAEPPGAWPPATAEADLDQLSWELYDGSRDPAQCNDLAAADPNELSRLVEGWWAAAGKYQVLPIDTRARAKRWSAQPLPVGADENLWLFHGRCGPYERGVGPTIAGRSFRLTADVTVTHTDDEPVQGVLYALGGLHGGYSWYLSPGTLVFEVNLMNVDRATVTAPVLLPPGEHRLELHVHADEDLRGQVVMTVDGTPVGEGEVDRLLKVPPIGSGRTQVGFDPDPTVSDAYRAPFPFTGQLHRLTVTTGPRRVTGVEEHHSDLRAQ